MNKLRIFATSFIIFTLLFTPASATENIVFSNKILNLAYSKIHTIVETKTQNWDSWAKKAVQTKIQPIIQALQSIDQAAKKKDKIWLQKGVLSFRGAFQDLSTALDSPQNTNQGPSQAYDTALSVSASPVNITYYADVFEWGNTANGNVFSQNFFSSSQCKTPFNTLVQVINNNKSVIIKNNDRPNCTLHPDIIDLTKTAFSSIGKLTSGKIPGSFVTLGSVPKAYYKRFIPSDAFASLGVTLDANIPNTYLPNETIHISGKELLGKEDTIVFLQSPSGKDISLSQKGKDSKFEYFYPLEEIGNYRLVVASGLGFETSTFIDITVLDPNLFSLKKLFPTANPPSFIDSLNVERIEFSDLKAIYLIHFPTDDLYTLSIKQDNNSIQYSGFWTIAIRSDALNAFGTKPANITVTVSRSSTAFSHDTYTVPTTVFQKNMELRPGYKTEKNENITVSLEQNNLMIHGFIPKGVNVEPEVVLILPSGNVAKYTLNKSAIDNDGFLKRWVVFEKIIPLTETGEYLVELNYNTGFAAYNGPIIYGDFLPILPSSYDSVAKGISGSLSVVREQSLKFINTLRDQVGKAPLSFDDTLNALATIKANDMAEHNYLSHYDSNGEKITGTAKRNGISLSGNAVGENVAGGNVGSEILLVGLANSGGHRENMLGNWKKLWVGYAVKNNQVYYTQVFGQ